MTGLPAHHVAIDSAPLHEAGLTAPIAHPETLRNGTSSHVNGHGRPVPEGWALPYAPRMPFGRAEMLAAPVAARPEGFYLLAGKRMIDAVGAVLSLIVLSPLMLLVAIAIKLESRGPVLYRSTRIGKDGRPFEFLKFRSMMDGADQHRQTLSHLNEMDGPTFKISRDPRVTRVGRLLRVSSIDEIPQFLNVLRGEMSLVGPRPPIPEEVAQYEPWQCRRLDVRPGITCLWQISGRSTLSFKEWMRLDLEYIKHQSFWLDMRILLRTIPAVLSREGAY
ncbi:MAG: sugar transferase [Candidatus Eisenbacteria bacterium]